MITRLLPLTAVAATGVLGFVLATNFVSLGESSGGGQARESGLVTPDKQLEHSLARPEDGTTAYITLVDDAWRSIIGEETWKTNIVDNLDRVAVSDEGVFQEVLADFEDFPVYWPGLEFHGLPLTKVIRSYGPHLTPPEDLLILLYGTCTPSSEGGCRIPVQVRVEPYCYAQRGSFAPEAAEGSVSQVRGADAQFISGALRLWMGDVSVRLSASSEDQTVELAEALVTANGRGPATADEPFPALDGDCSGATLEPPLSE